MSSNEGILNLDYCYEIAKNCECGDIAQFDCQTGHITCLPICDLAERLRTECPEDCTSFFDLCETQDCIEGTIPYITDCDTIDFVTPCDLAEQMKNSGCLKVDITCEDIAAIIQSATPDTLTIDNCQGGLINFSVTIPEQDDEDELVKRSEDCTEAKYLNELIAPGKCMTWYEDENHETVADDDYCGTRYLGPDCEAECSCCRKGVASITLSNDFIIEQNIGASGFYMPVDGELTANINGISITTDDRGGNTAQWIENFSYGPILASETGAVCNVCSVGRLVKVSFRGSIEASWGVNGLRVQLYKLCTDNTFEPVAEWRDSPISDPDSTGDGLPDNYTVTSAGGGGNKLNAGYQYQERQSFSADRIVWLDPGCCLVPVFKVSSFNDHPDYDSSIPAQVAILGVNNATDGAPSGDLGAVIEIETVDDCCIVAEGGDCEACRSADDNIALTANQTVTNGEIVETGGGTFTLPATLPGTGAGG